MNRSWLFSVALASIVFGIVLAAPVASAATTYYAAPTGSGSTCSEGSPCSIEEAVEVAQNGDSVVVTPGTYALTGSGFSVSTKIDFGGRPGSPAPVIETSGSANFYVTEAAKATIHDLRIVGNGGLVANSGTVDRVFVDFTGPYSSACVLAVGTTMRDSVCWAHNSNSASGLDIIVPGPKGKVVLRNDDFVGHEAAGLEAEAESGGELEVDGANVIAKGDENVDIATEFSGFSTVEVKLSHSDYATVEEFPPFTKVTPPGTNANITAPPSFVDAAGGNFAEPADAPTIDAGANDPADGTADILGNQRSLPRCIGGAAVADIGAYEFVPSQPCSPSQPPASPGPSAVPISNQIKVGKLIRNAKRGPRSSSSPSPTPER
jgi:hypothetical protein